MAIERSTITIEQRISNSLQREAAIACVRFSASFNLPVINPGCK
ncbi:MAG: hypothetical protein RIE73_06790 [Coleofasciculus sp. C1-SOL-03]